MTFEEIEKLILDYSKVDIQHLDTESLNTPYIYGKVLNIHTNEKRKLKQIEDKLGVIEFELTEYYKGNASPDVYKKKPLHTKILKSQIPQYVMSNEVYRKTKSEYETQIIKCEALQDFLKMLSQRTFHIKNAIDYLKYKNGL